MENKENAFGKSPLAIALIILGWILCGYLAFRSTQLKGDPGALPDLCNAIFGSSCDKALRSLLAWRLGYPLTGWGLAYFGLLGLLFSFRTQVTSRLVLLIAAFGTGVSIVQSVIILKAGIPCPMCLAIHGINLATLVVMFRSIRPHFSMVEQQNTSGNRSFVRWIALVILFAILGGASEYGILKASFGQKNEVKLDELAKKFQAEPVFDIPPIDNAPRIGPPDAPVQMVVFSSFQCPACQAFAPSLENIHKQFGNKLSIRFKNFPLSTSCNPMVVEDMQPRSCHAAFAALAAHRQNRFWEYHDQIFDSNLELEEETLRSIAEKIGLNLEQWDADRQSDETKAIFVEDLELAHAIGINATPTVLINGRRVDSFQESALVFLIQNELMGASK